MYARAVDDAGIRLRELRREELEDFGLAGLALGLAIAATQVRPALAMPLLLGGITVAALGLRALWRHWDLLERLAAERDAYVIPAVLAYASREASMQRRRRLAGSLRYALREPSLPRPVRGFADELEALASELDDSALALDPACAVACLRLLTDASTSPLLDPAARPEALRSRISQIRRGFTPKAG